jgi:hypothetical protein
LFTGITLADNERSEEFQTAVSAQPIRENGVVNITISKLGRTLIASKDICQSTCSSTRQFTAGQHDLEVWPRIGAKRSDFHPMLFSPMLKSLDSGNAPSDLQM